MPLIPGRRLGSYEITAQIGAGGMGEVYRATDTKLGRQVAIKVLPAALAQDPDRLARFDREARTLATLNHPNIAAIHGLEESDGVKALVMELVEGPTLADRVAAGAITIDETLAIAQQIAEALEAAHEQGIVHRDLKPANVKVRPDGTVKVLDFGLAKAMSAGDPIPPARADLTASPTLSIAATQYGIVLGTAAYMSPEQAKGLPVDRRADIFAFGCVLFEMLTGQQAFRGELVTEIMASVINQEPDYTRLPGRIPPRLEALVRRCLRKDPRQRWQAAGDLRLEIEEIRRGPLDAPVGVRTRDGSRVATWMGWAVAAAAIVAGAAAWYLKPSPPPLVTRVQVPLVAAPNLVDAIAISPDGRRVVYPANGRLWLRALDVEESVPIPGTEGGSGPFFSFDGERVAFFTETELKKVDLRGGLPVHVTKVPQGIQGVWDEKDRIYFGRVGTFPLSVVNANGGTVQTFAKSDRDIDFPDSLPGGEWILFSRQRSPSWDDAEIVARSVATGEQKVVLENGFYARYVPTGHLVFARAGALHAVKFDAERLQPIGDPVLVVEDVQSLNFLAGQGQFAISRTGTLVYRKATLNAGVLQLRSPKGDRRRLDLPPQAYVNPRLSPEGDRFAVEIVRDDGKSDLLVHSLSGDTQGRVVAQDATQPVWLSSNRLVFNGTLGGASGVYSFDLDGASAPVLLLKGDNVSPWVPNDVSPDGKVLLLMRGGPPWGLFSFPVTGGGEPQRIPNTEAGFAGGAQFSPDGQWFAYQRADAIGATNLTMALRVQRYPPKGPEYTVSAGSRMFPVWWKANEIVYQAGLFAESLRLASVTVRPGDPFGVEKERDTSIQVTGHRLQRSFDIDARGQLLAVVPTELGPAQLEVVINWFEELKARVR